MAEVPRWIVYYRRRGRHAIDAAGRNVAVTGVFHALLRSSALRLGRQLRPGSDGRSVATLTALRWEDAPLYLRALAEKVGNVYGV